MGIWETERIIKIDIEQQLKYSCKGGRGTEKKSHKTNQITDL